MSIAEEARAEAERAVESIPPEGRLGTVPFKVGFFDGYIAGASRKPEAAPSDTDLRELIDVIADRLGEHPKAGNVFDITDEATTMIRLDEGVEVLAEFIAPALVSLLSRTSQPVQVEVTDEARGRAIEVVADLRGMATQGHMLLSSAQIVDAALSAALGGGDHAE